MLIDLGPAYNWCDRRCERCPLIDDCLLAVRQRERRESNRRRGRDPDAPETIARDIADNMEATIALLEKVAAEEGISLADCEPPEDSATQRLLSGRGLAFSVATEVLLRAHPEHHEALLAGFIAGAKTARIAAAVTPTWELDASWSALTCDTMPNIILIERLLQVVTDAVQELAATADREALVSFERAHVDLVRALLPLSAAVDDSVREALAELTAAGHAPSPYCVRPSTPIDEREPCRTNSSKS